MQAKSLGKIAVPTPGTLVRVSTDTALMAARIQFIAPAANTNPAFLGVASFSKTTYAGLIREFPAGAVQEINSPEGGNTLRLSDYWVDVTTANEGLVVSYWIR